MQYLFFIIIFLKHSSRLFQSAAQAAGEDGDSTYLVMWLNKLTGLKAILWICWPAKHCVSITTTTAQNLNFTKQTNKQKLIETITFFLLAQFTLSGGVLFYFIYFIEKKHFEIEVYHKTVWRHFFEFTLCQS